MRASKLAQKVVVMAFGLCYASLLLVWLSATNQSLSQPLATSDQSADHLNSGHSNYIGYQERAPRSIYDTRNHHLDDNINSNKLNILSNSIINNPNIHHNNDNKRVLTSMNDIFISVKTTKKFHSTRLDVILKTWFNLAKDQTYFFTDANDDYYNEISGGHLINTNCSSSHNRKALCCKMSVEFDTFIDSNKRWFCHFDDDNYVNVPQLVQMLRHYSPLEDWYLGKPSIRQPLEIVSRDSKQKKISFWFATGGAGFCLSRSLALKMVPMASGGKFISIGEHIRLPDDVTLGYIVEHLLSKRLTVIDKLHSHLEPMKFIKSNQLSQQITFSYSQFGQQFNTLSIEGFDPTKDETRFLSLHCHLFPNFKSCRKLMS